jgi:hypothetical protein
VDLGYRFERGLRNAMIQTDAQRIRQAIGWRTHRATRVTENIIEQIKNYGKPN